MRRSLLARGYPLLYPIIDTAANHAYDVLAAGKCKPLVVWITGPVRDAWGLTLERLQEDIDRLKEAEAAYEAEAARQYDFTPVSQEPTPLEQNQSIDQEPELAEQHA